MLYHKYPCSSAFLFSGFLGATWINYSIYGRFALSLFLSTYINKVDKKGRVSVPASFRAALAAEVFQGIVVFKSHAHTALEGFPISYMSEISSRLESFDLFSDAQDDLATSIFAESVQLPIDGDGRIVLPQNLIEAIQIDDQAAFVGLGHKFQIWSPKLLEGRKKEAQENVKSQKLTLPKGSSS